MFRGFINSIQWLLQIFPRVQSGLRRKAHHSLISSAEYKNAWSCTSTPLYEHRVNFTEQQLLKARVLAFFVLKVFLFFSSFVCNKEFLCMTFPSDLMTVCVQTG
jgi:hypothetical protein